LASKRAQDVSSPDNLDEAAATTFGVDFLEALLFLSLNHRCVSDGTTRSRSDGYLLDNTERRYEETQNDCHEAINLKSS
jgi:hypothetical protein